MPPSPALARTSYGPIRTSGPRERAHGAAHARPAQTAVAAGVLAQVLLVVVLGVIEGRRGAQLGRDLALAGLAQAGLVGLPRGLGQRALLVVEGVERRAVLRAHVVALAHALRRVVALPEDLQQVGVGD